MINLQSFCDETRDSISQPFLVDGNLYATNGKIIIRSDDVKGNFKEIENEHVIDLVHRMEWGNDCELQDLPNVNGELKEIKCEECGGSGTLDVDNKYNKYEVECKSCEGVGYKMEYNDVKIGDLTVSAGLLSKIKDLPNVKCAVYKKRYLYFKFDGGEGFLLGMI